MSKSVIFIFSLIILPIGWFLEGYVLSVLWSWFVTNTFNLPPLSLSAAVGLMFVVGFLSYKPTQEDFEDPETNIKTATRLISQMFVKAVFFLLAGWVLHLFI